MKIHKFNFKHEAIWILIFSLFPLVIGILITLFLFILREFDLFHNT